MKYSSYDEQRFRASVDKALVQVQKILDHSRHPRLAGIGQQQQLPQQGADQKNPATAVPYADTFALAEFCTHTGLAALLNALERLGLDNNLNDTNEPIDTAQSKSQINRNITSSALLSKVLFWVHEKHETVTLRLEAQDHCRFWKERDVDVVTGEREVRVDTTTNHPSSDRNVDATTSSSSSGFFSSVMMSSSSDSNKTASATSTIPTNNNNNRSETTRVKVVSKIKEYHWKVDVSYRLILFPGTDASKNAVELLSRSTSTFLITSNHRGIKPPTPIPESTLHAPIDLNMTWFFLHIDRKEHVCHFQIDRNHPHQCKTPRRNKNVDAAFEFYSRLHTWCEHMLDFFVHRIQGEIANAHQPAQRLGISGSQSPESVESGARGTIVGLQKEPTFNGQLVTVLDYNSEQQRFRVEPVDKTIGLPGTLLIKPSNLHLDATSNAGPTLTENISTESLFCPILPLMENNAVFADIHELLKEQCRSMDEVIAKLTKVFPPTQLVKLLSISEASIVLLALHIQDLCTGYQNSVDYIESMLKAQLVTAIGKEVSSQDFDRFMVFHNARLFGPSYTPTPFTYSVRRPGHFPVGTLSIENVRLRNDPIYTLVRHVPAKSVSSSMFVPISAATRVELKCDRYLHGWLIHHFQDQMTVNPSAIPNHSHSEIRASHEYQLVARARQFSSFLLVLGSLNGPNQFDPKDAIILQNKDEVMIPLLTSTLPTAKEFKNSIASLSPDQQAFAQSYRSMQLESSVFGLCIIQLKPQLENLLGLPEGALIKEIQLTQDLMSLFVDYQIPSDLLTFDGPIHTDTATKVEAVKGYVQSILAVIDNVKEKQLVEEERKADMRAELTTFEGHPQSPPMGIPLLPAGMKTASDNYNPAALSAAHSLLTPASAFEQQSNSVSLQHESMDASNGSRFPKNIRRKLNRFGGEKGGQSHRSLPASIASTSVMKKQASIPLLNVSVENVQPSSPLKTVTKSDASKKGLIVPPLMDDFTLIPKILDTKLEQYDTATSLRSTIIQTGSLWTLNRQDNLLTPSQSHILAGSQVEAEKIKAFDLLDAMSRSGALPIASSELHVMVGVSHCFENDVMGSILQENVNPIERVEMSTTLLASTIFGQAPANLIADPGDMTRLTRSFPELTTDLSEGGS